jgi:hypothetical protein
VTNEQIDELVDRMARPIFIYRMAHNSPHKGADKRLEMARKEIEGIIVDLFGPDLEDDAP